MSRVAAVALGPGIHRIPTLGDFINSFAVLHDDGQVTLVDCGLSRASKPIVAGLAAIGRHPADVTRIVLTHAHSDHAGGARRMVTATGVTGVDVHADDARYVATGQAPPRDPSAGRLFARMPGGGFKATDVAAVLHDGDLVDGVLRVHHTPGHTPGHISLVHEPSGVLITGDSIFNMRAKMTWPVAAFCTSARQNQQTAAVLGDLDYGVAAFTHGPEIREGAREAIRGFLRRAR
jgi:glyoxylase-like metal-dependent hydrolase (beta-lactamase superfamily II)